MKTPRLLVLLLASFLVLLTPRPAQANVEVSFDFFHDTLSPYGEWVEVASYGYCWRPTGVDRDWTPYADGYWAFTDAGWTWVSYEEFGGVVYHYGRWIFAQDDGWCWVPDYEWGPAWVSWRQSDDYVGWAPLPPEARWQPTIGFSTWVDRQYDIGPGYYNFCHARDFGAPVLRPVIINRLENVTIIRRTVNITNITYNTGYGNSRVIYNGGLNYDAINRRSERRVPALKLVQNGEINLPGSRDWDRDRDRNDRDGRRRNFNGQVTGNQLVVTAPSVKPPGDAAAYKSNIKKVVSAGQVTRGWNGVKNDEVRRELRQEMERQTKGLTPQTAPARPVAAVDLKPLPEKADPKAPSPVATRDKRDRAERKDRTPEVAGQPNPIPNVPGVPTTPVTSVPPAERATDKSMRERGRDQAPQEAPRPVTGQPGLKPFNPVAGTERKPEQAPVVRPPVANPRSAQSGDEPTRMRDGRKPSDRTADDARQPDRDGERRGEMKRQQGEAAAQQEKALAGQEDARRKLAENAAEQQQRAAEMQRKAEAQRQQGDAAARQKMQAEQEKAGRQQAEAAGRQKQMDAQRQAEGMRQRQREEAAGAERQKMQAEQGRAARQQAEAAAGQQKQMEAQQRAAQESARARESDRGRQEMESRRQKSEQQAAEQQRRQGMEQQKAAQDGQRQQAERAAGEQRRQREQGEAAEQARRAQDGQREQMRQQMDAQRQQREAQRAAPPVPSAPPPAPPAQENERRDRGRDRKD